MIASALLGMIVVTLMIMFGQMVNASTKNRMMAAGSFFAEKVLAREINVAQESGRVPAFTAINNGSEWITTTDPNTGTEFLYRFDPEQISSYPGLGETWYVEVEVSWWQSGQQAGTHQSRVGQGKLHLKRGRTVYIQRE